MSPRRRWLAHPNARWVAVLLGVLAMCLSLDIGLTADDYMLKHAYVGGTPLPWSPLGASGLPGPTDPAQVAQARDLGLLPWTASDGFRFAFLRPLAALTHRLDFLLFPGLPWLMHLHNVAWFGLFLTLATALYRRIEGATWVAGLAALLLALDDAHGPTVGWIANRNLVMAGTFGMAALLAQHRRIDGTPPAWLAPALLLLGLASNEGALGLWPLAIAMIGLLDDRPTRWRDAAALTAVCMGWVVLWAVLGMGVHGSGIYADPGSDPIGAIVQVATNAPILLMSATTGIWADFFSFADGSARQVWWAIALAITAATALIAVRLGLRDRRAAVWAIGLVGAVLPTSGSFPSDRLLFLASVPAAALLAHLVRHLRDDRRAYRLAGLVAVLVLARHLGANVLLAPVRARSMEAPQDLVDRSVATLDLPNAGDHVVVLINPVSDALGAYGVFLAAVDGLPLPRAMHGLYAGLSPLTVTRLDATTLRLSPEAAWMAHPSERLSRDPDSEPFSVGDQVHLPHMTITVEAVSADGRPAQTLVHFDRPLEDPLFQWHAWDEIQFRPFTPPAVGETRTLPAADPVAAWFGQRPRKPGLSAPEQPRSGPR